MLVAPGVVVRAVPADVDHRVHRRAAAERLHPRPVRAARVELLLLGGLVVPVPPGLEERRERRGDVISSATASPPASSSRTEAPGSSVSRLGARPSPGDEVVGGCKLPFERYGGGAGVTGIPRASRAPGRTRPGAGRIVQDCPHGAPPRPAPAARPGERSSLRVPGGPGLAEVAAPACPADGVWSPSAPPACAARTGTRGRGTTPSRCRTLGHEARRPGEVGPGVIECGSVTVTVPFVCGSGPALLPAGRLQGARPRPSPASPARLVR